MRIPEWSDITGTLAVVIAAATLLKMPRPEGKHRRRKRYRRKKRQR